jgi:hypothetical protein
VDYTTPLWDTLHEFLPQKSMATLEKLDRILFRLVLVQWNHDIRRQALAFDDNESVVL